MILESNRDLIADTLQGLRLGDPDTLRWCDETEAGVADAQCQADTERLTDLEDGLDKIAEAFNAWTLRAMKEPAAFRDELTKILADLGRP